MMMKLMLGVVRLRPRKALEQRSSSQVWMREGIMMLSSCYEASEREWLVVGGWW